jgi:voltage-gated hydrogen channel 1
VLVDFAYTLLSSDCAAPIDEPPDWLEVLSLISTLITTLFLVEIPLTIWSLGFEFYNPRGPVTHAGLHVFDALIILTTFVLEVVLRGRERELAGLLIILRLWRLLKLVGGE